MGQARQMRTALISCCLLRVCLSLTSQTEEKFLVLSDVSDQVS